jgi:RNA recognition motif-containing protein
LRYLPRTATEARIREMLSSAGEITRVWISKDKTTDECKGYAFVNFRKNAMARNAVLHYNTWPKNHMDGKNVVIEPAKAWDDGKKEIAMCTYGLECSKPDCYFRHPAGWAHAPVTATKSSSGGSKTKGGGAPAAGGVDGGVRKKKVRSKTRLGAKARQRAKKRAEKESAGE